MMLISATIRSLLLLCAVFPSMLLAIKMMEDTNYGDVHQSGDSFRQQVNNLRQEGQNAEIPVPKPDDDMYYFFSLHDYNHDAHLDGHELRVAFTEFENKLDETRGGPDASGKLAKDRLKLPDVEKLIDHALEEDDYDNDGMISWAEYLQSQKKHKQM
ncbi:hypothetical protein HDV05_007672 [Chytridiales sp. JEL 0842]|nr:hypothetical protein HDV05_007672 [Chytridiales sp. JEL 0842]